ncbi:MAG: glycosyltransferase [Planctomycetota bacterium]
MSYALRSHAMSMVLMARELRRRSRSVAFATQEEGKGWLEAHGVPWVPFETGPGTVARLVEARARASEQENWFESQATAMQSLVDEYPSSCDALGGILRDVRPAVVVASVATSAAVDLAAREGIRLAIRSPYVPDTMRRYSLGWPHWTWRAGAHGFWGRLGGVRRLRAVRDRFATLRRRVFPPAGSLPFERSLPLMAATAPCIEPPGEFTPNVTLLGPMLSDALPPLAAATREWLDARRDEGVVLAALGTLVRPQERLVRALAEGFVASGQNVLWALPEPQRRHAGDLGPRIRVEPFVEQLAALGHPAVRSFVSHAGAGSMMESLSRGVPMLCIPFMLDQPYYADRVAATGAGLRLDRHGLHGAHVADALTRIRREPRFAATASDMAASLAGMPGAAGGADVVDRLLR